MTTKPVLITIDKDLHKKSKEYCEKDDRSFSSLVSKLLKGFFGVSNVKSKK